MAMFKKHDRKVKAEPITEFNKPKVTSYNETKPTAPKTKSVIGKTMLVKGTINSDEEILVEGEIEGKLNSQNLVVVGLNGVVNADIDAREVIIKGTVNGNVKGSFKVEIVPDGVLNGNIISQRVVLAEGAVFKGNIDMSLK